MEARLLLALQDTPVVLLQGPRQCGKTTLSQLVGHKLGYEYISFDDLSTYKSAQEDPQSFINDLTRPTIIDEVQRVPEVLLPIKAQVDKWRQPGQFLITGSVNVFHFPKVLDSLAGRIEALNLHPLSQLEIEQKTFWFLDHLFQPRFNFKKFTQNDIKNRIIGGGYPAALQREGHRRVAWYVNYIETLLQHDALKWAGLRFTDLLPDLIEVACQHTAQLLNINTLSKTFKTNHTTISNYLGVLEKLFLIKILPAWHSHKKSVKASKLHITDSGFASALLQLNTNNLSQDGNLYGRVFESFILQELQRQASASQKGYRFFHYRENDRFEVDIVIAQGRQKLVGLEMKTSATLNDHDFRGLKRLEQVAGKQFICGAILYQGNNILRFGEKLVAIPAQALWCAAPSA